MNQNNADDPHQQDKSDPYQQILFDGYRDQEIAEMQTLMQKWDKATYPTLAHSIVEGASPKRKLVVGASRSLLDF